MTNPNNVLKYVAKRPYEYGGSANTPEEAEVKASAHREAGKEVRVTRSYNKGSKTSSWTVWVRDPA